MIVDLEQRGVDPALLIVCDQCRREWVERELHGYPCPKCGGWHGHTPALGGAPPVRQGRRRAVLLSPSP